MNVDEGFYDKYKFILFLLFGLILIGFIWWYGGNWLWEFWKNDQANLRGDAYGALNTLFSGLAFAGIIISILMQSEELKLQRKELKATRDEFKIQSEVFKKDNFEKGFYNLLELLGSSLDNFYIESHHGNEKKGKEGLRIFLDKGFLELIPGKIRLGIGENPINNEMLDQYLGIPEAGSNTLKVYIKTFNLIITSIFKKIHNNEEIPYYIAILKSRMIDAELDLVNIKKDSISNNELKEYYTYFLEYKGTSSM